MAKTKRYPRLSVQKAAEVVTSLIEWTLFMADSSADRGEEAEFLQLVENLRDVRYYVRSSANWQSKAGRVWDALGVQPNETIIQAAKRLHWMAAAAEGHRIAGIRDLAARVAALEDATTKQLSPAGHRIAEIRRLRAQLNALEAAGLPGRKLPG